MAFYSMTREEMKKLMDVALGKAKADLVIANGNIVNVYTREIMSGYSVVIKGGRIAYVGKDGKHAIGPETQVIDAEGRVVIPGFIDTHTHIASLFDMNESAKHAMKTGTTTIVTEAAEVVAALGYAGLRHYLKALKEQPIKIFLTISPMITIHPETTEYALRVQNLRKLLKEDNVLGLGESFWLKVLQQDDRVLSLLAETLALGKKAEGHTTGVRNDKLVAYFSTGISSCHEPITEEEVLERLRLGVHTMVREGTVRKDLQTISELRDKRIDLRRLVLVSDGVSPETLLKHGYMDLLVQKVIDFGFDPITAIQMATINAAEHFSLDGFVGGIAPGKFADMVIVPNVHDIRPELVISNGRIVAQNGQPLVTPEKPVFPKTFRQTIHLPRKLKPSDFQITVDDEKGPVTVRVINMVTELVTREEQVVMTPSGGFLEADVSQDLLKVAVIDRFGGQGKMFTGFIRGFKMNKGAFATSVAWDILGIVVVGTNEQDMTQAVNKVFELQGGIVICVDEEMLAELPLPVAGVISDLPMEAIVDRLAKIQQIAADLGIPFPDAHLTLTTLTSPAIPFLRICESGLIDIRENKVMSLIVEDE